MKDSQRLCETCWKEYHEDERSINIVRPYYENIIEFCSFRCLYAYTTDSEISTQDLDVARIISSYTRYEILKRQQWKCNQCNVQLKYKQENAWEGQVAHIDHIYPYSKRNTYYNGKLKINEINNLQALCRECNLKKKDKVIQ